MSAIEELIQTFPQANWNWDALSKNRTISEHFIKNHLGLPWEYTITHNKNISASFIIKYFPHIFKSYKSGHQYIRFTIDDLHKHKDSIYFDKLSRNKYIDTNIIQTFIHEKWEWKFLSCNESIPIDFIIDTIDHPNYHWNWQYISGRNDITLQFIETYMKYIHLDHICFTNKNITIQFLATHFEQMFPDIGNENDRKHFDDVHRASCFSCITPEFIQQRLHIIWDWHFIWLNENFSHETIQQYPAFDVMWDMLSENINLSVEFVKNNLSENWNLAALAQHSEEMYNMLEKNFVYFDDYGLFDYHLLCDYVDLNYLEKNIKNIFYCSEMSLNPHLTVEFVKKYNEKFDFSTLSINKFPVEAKKRKKEQIKCIQLINFSKKRKFFSSDTVKYIATLI